VRRGDVCLHHCGSAYERAQALKLARAVMPPKRRFRLNCTPTSNIQRYCKFDKHPDRRIRSALLGNTGPGHNRYHSQVGHTGRDCTHRYDCDANRASTRRLRGLSNYL
jgi:hypothetical protein